MKKITFSLVSVLALSALSFAGGDIAPVVEEPIIVEDNSAFYVGLGYGYFNQSNDDIGNTPANIELALDTVLLQAGYEYNEYIAIEGRYWIGLGDLEQSGSIENDLSGDYSVWGIYLKPMYPVTEDFDVYGLLGYASTSLEADAGSYWDTDGFSWGLGAQYAVTENWVVFADYVNLGMPDSFDFTDTNSVLYPDVDADINLYTINVGISYKF